MENCFPLNQISILVLSCRILTYDNAPEYHIKFIAPGLPVYNKNRIVELFKILNNHNSLINNIIMTECSSQILISPVLYHIS